VRFEILTTLCIRIMIVWDMPLYGVAGRYQSSEAPAPFILRVKCVIVRFFSIVSSVYQTVLCHIQDEY